MKLLKLIPVWLYLAVLLAAGWAVTGYRLHAVNAELDKAKAVIAGNADALRTQKQTASALLEAETARVTALQAQLNEARDRQERTDGQNQITVDNLSRKLRDAGRLRDPNAKPAQCGGSSGSTAGKAGGSPAAGAANPAEADGVLSVEFDQLLKRLTREADEINNAYASCRASLLNTP